MRTVVTIFRKELLDTLRDRRTILFILVIPLFLFPVLFRVMFAVEKSHTDREKGKTLRVVVIDHSESRSFETFVGEYGDVVVVQNVDVDSLRALVRADSFDGAFVVESAFDEDVAALGSGRIDFYFKSTGERKIANRRLRTMVNEFEERLLSGRFEALGLGEDVTDAVKLRPTNVATAEEQIGSKVGGFLPYIFILFCFMGAMYPAIDLGAGEKERGTMETLLTAPVHRFHILLGKFGVIVVSGLASAVVSMAGLYIAVRTAPELPGEFFALVVKILGWETIVQIFALLLPLTIFFAGILLSLSLSARSFKEAQSIISPLNMAVIIPAAIGMMPGVDMNFLTAIIPVLNVSLATKEIISGTIQTHHLAAVYASLVVFAMGSLGLSVLWFRRESTIFRA